MARLALLVAVGIGNDVFARGTGATATQSVVVSHGEARGRARGDSSSRVLCRAPARSAGEARHRPFERVVLTIVSSWQKSNERRRPRGRRGLRETGAALRSETPRGKPRGGKVRPFDGRRFGSSARSRPSRVAAERWSRPRAHRASSHGSRGFSILVARRRRLVRRAVEVRVGRWSAVTEASEDGTRSASQREENARRRRSRAQSKDSYVTKADRDLRSVWGVVKTRHAFDAAARKSDHASSHRTKRGCPSSKCRWQSLVARISGR
jgi:hypothetical protein